MKAPVTRCGKRAFQVAGISLLVFGNLAVHAAALSPCTSPTVLQSPKVQVFLLPYTAHKPLTAQGRELAAIVQRHVLYAALKYQSIAVEELTATDPYCDYGYAAARVLPRLKPGQVAIFLWGRLFEQGGDLQLQSTVIYTRGGSAC